jgi:hypothetical protein
MDMESAQIAVLVKGLAQVKLEGLDRLYKYIQDGKPLLLSAAYIRDIDGVRHCCPMVASLPPEKIAEIVSDDVAVHALDETYGPAFDPCPWFNYDEGELTYEDGLVLLENMSYDLAVKELLMIIMKARLG